MLNVYLVRHVPSNRSYTIYSAMSGSELLDRHNYAAERGIFDNPFSFDMLLDGPQSFDVNIICTAPDETVARHYALNFGWGQHIDIADKTLMRYTLAIPSRENTNDRFHSPLLVSRQAKVLYH